MRAIPYFIVTYFIKSTIQAIVACDESHSICFNEEWRRCCRFYSLAQHPHESPSPRPLLWHARSLQRPYRRCASVQDQLKQCPAAATSASIAAAAFLLGGEGVTATAVGCNAPRATIAYAACESFLGRFLRLFQPIGTLNAFRVCDSNTANDCVQRQNDGIGISLANVVFGVKPSASSSTSPSSSASTSSKPFAPFSTTNTTRATFERFCITTHDIAISLVTYAFTEFIASFIKHGLIAKAQHGKFEYVAMATTTVAALTHRAIITVDVVLTATVRAHTSLGVVLLTETVAADVPSSFTVEAKRAWGSSTTNVECSRGSRHSPSHTPSNPLWWLP